VGTDEHHLLTAIGLARRARDRGNNPFGSLLVGPEGDVVLEAENTVVTERDPTGHAELNLVREAGGRLDAASLAGCALYASTEPCAMCAGAIYWAGIGRVVFALSSATLRTMLPEEQRDYALALSCREVFAQGGRTIDVSGPHLEDEAATVHEGYWVSIG
jgi:tRNA(Arg) A34 adenosine deaminase TadA